MRPGKPQFTPAEVFQIRLEWDSQTIDVRAWARVKGCVPETIRKIGRRDTYTTGDYVGEATGASASDLPGDEPTAEELAASFARLKQAADGAGVLKTEVDQMLDEARKEPT